MNLATRRGGLAGRPAPTAREVLEMTDMVDMGGYNLNEGFRAARYYLGEAGEVGGFGILYWGNSLLESMGVDDYLNNGTCYLTTAILQGTDLQCGYAPDLGHVPIRSGNAVAADGNWGGLNRYDVDGSGLGAADPYNFVFAFSGTGTNLTSTSGGDAINRKQTLVTGGTTQRIGWLLQSGTATPTPRGMTRLDLILGPGGTITYDVQEGGTTFITSGAASGGTSVTGTQNTSAYAAGDRKNVGTSFDNGSDYWIQMNPGASGNLNTDGIIVSNSNRGIQGLNATRVGASFSDTYNAATKAATVTTPTLRTGIPCANMRVAVLNFITNECIGQMALDTFQSNYQTRITDLLAAGVVPLLEIPCPYDEAAHGYAIPWSAYVDRIKTLADANNCPMWNAWEMTGRPTTHALYETTLGWANTSFNRHLTNKAARWQAIMRAAVIYRGLRGY